MATNFEWASEGRRLLDPTVQRDGQMECPYCDRSWRVRVVRYDRLGYPVCPDCGRATR